MRSVRPTIVRVAALVVTAAAATIPTLDLAIVASLLVLMVAIGVATRFVRRYWPELPTPLKIVHFGVSMQVLGTVIRMIEASLVQGDLVVPSWADVVVVPGMIITMVGLVGAANARAATARIGDLLDAAATGLIPIGFMITFAASYFTGAAAGSERALNAFFFASSAITLVMFIVLIYGPGARSDGAIWVAAGGLAAVSFEFVALLGVATEAAWTPQVLRVLAAAVVLYAIGTSYETYPTFASPGSRPQRYRWQPYFASVAANLILLAAFRMSVSVALVATVAGLLVVRVIVDQRTLQRLTRVVDVQSSYAASLAEADSDVEALAAAKTAVTQLAGSEKVAISGSALATVESADATHIVSADRSTSAAIGTTVPGYVYVAVEQMVNLLSLALVAIEERRRRGEERSKAAAEAAAESWRRLAVGSHEVGLQVLGGVVSAATPNATAMLGTDPTGKPAEQFAAILKHQLANTSAFEDPSTPGRWFKVIEHDGGHEAIIYTIRDVTLEVVDARTDPITGLRNHSDFDDQPEITDSTVIMLHLHDVDRTAESAGQEAANRLLREFTQRVTAAYRAQEEQIWRGVGPRLIVLATNEGDTDWVDRRRQELCQPLTFDGEVFTPTITIGAAQVGDSTTGMKARTPAETALKHALRVSPNTTVWFTDELSEAVRRAWKIETAFAKALTDPAAGGFSVHYQPIVATTDGYPAVAAEALARWVHPKLGPISPGEFIPIAEEKGLVDTIDQFVLNTAVADLARFRLFHPEFKVHVNMSPTTGLAAKLGNISKTLSVRDPRAASSLVVEITESGLGHQDLDPIVEACKELRALGMGIALDDFGAGESNFARIAKLPLTEVKLDRKLVTSWDDEFQARLLIANFQQQGLECVAEGVEDQQAVDLITEAGAEYIQGFAFARPAPLEETLALMVNRSSRPPLPTRNKLGEPCSQNGDHTACEGWWPSNRMEPADTCVCPCHARSDSWPGWQDHSLDIRSLGPASG